jgi:hypothetical protein
MSMLHLFPVAVLRRGLAKLWAKNRLMHKGIAMRIFACKYRVLTICLFWGLTFATTANYADRALAQGNAPVQLTIRRTPYAIDDAARIAGFTLDGKFYDLSKARDSAPIQAMPGWLERLQIIVQNISPKSVIAGTIQVWCPALGNGHTPQEPRVTDQFILGIVPDRFGAVRRREDASSADTPSPIVIPPGGGMNFVLKNDFARMRKKLPQGDPTPDCTLDPREFFFSDGTMWSPRQFYKPDPSSDHGYVKATPEEFGMGAPAQYR